MRRIVHIIAVLGIVLPAFMSCRAISSFLSADETIAEVGQAKLYRSELNELIPRGIPAEDSVRLAKMYINTWALDQVFLAVAEEQLSKSEKDVTKELEDYRKSLLKYRYEQLFVNERLDTSVSDDRIERYYQDHEEKFILQRPVVKARFLLIAEDSPSLDKIKKKMASDEVQDLVDADSLAYSSALKFLTWGNEWIDASTLAREFGADHETMLDWMEGKWITRRDTSGRVSVAYVSEIMNAGRLAPIEYCTPSIRDMIISARKQSLISTLEQDLLKDARETGQLVIF
ncbi:MAG: hypothetical protein J6B97_05085 [Bacteroidales bacterium]|nr:hypothetical protein [Bacteroidales bacterium]